jgi:TonB-linked SusC/RagA family outer membrane protein
MPYCFFEELITTFQQPKLCEFMEFLLKAQPPLGVWRLVKLLAFMKLSVLLVLVTSFQVGARPNSADGQTVTLDVSNVSLRTVFSSITEQTGYHFIYTSNQLDKAVPVTLQVRNIPLAEALEKCFQEQPKLSYKVDRDVKEVIVAEKEMKALAASGVATQPTGESTMTVKGVIETEDGQPLSGASVSVVGSKKGTITDGKGVFTLSEVKLDATIEVSYIGYQTKKISIKGVNSFQIKLGIATGSLDQVEIIPYGSVAQRYSVGDLTTVSSKEIQEQPVVDPILALEGRVPGLYITQASGFVGSAFNLQILGQNTISSGKDPLYVVDGVPYGMGGLLPQWNVIHGGGNDGNSPSPFAFINPSDIESITVLKDADATSIYGSRAANGAILITTTKGKAGQTKFDFNLQDGFGQVGEKLHLLNTPQYLQMRHEALILDDIVTPGSSSYDINGVYDSTRSTDWQRALVGGAAKYENFSGSVSGGTSTTQFLLGATYHMETTVFPIHFGDNKGSVHLNLNQSSKNERFNMQLSASYQFDDNHLPFVDLTRYAMELAPDAPDPYNKDGSLNWQLQNGNSTWINPLAYSLQSSNEKTNNLISNIMLGYQIIKGLDIKCNFGYSVLNMTGIQTTPVVSQPPQYAPFFHGYSNFTFNNENSWIVEPQVDFKRYIAGGSLEMVIGGTEEQDNASGQQFETSGYTSDLLLQDIGDAATVVAQGQSASIYKYNALFGRLNYVWKRKYILDLTTRRDGSSRFGPANQFHDFWSAGGAWIFSEESFFKRNLSVLSFGKINASFGTTGNDQIGNYEYLSTYSPSGVAIPYQGTVGFQVNGIANPYLQWELTKKSNYGLTLGFLKDRLILKGDYFLTRSSNQLLGYNLPLITGFSTITKNFPAKIQNSGIELSLNTVNIKTRNFSWSTSLNFTVPKNKLISFPNLDSSSYLYTLVVGKPLNVVRVFNSAGVNSTTGLYQFYDSKKQITSSPSGPQDNYVLLNINPTFYGGVGNSFSYKRISLDVFFQFAKHITQNTFPNFGFVPGYFSASQDYGNQPTSVLRAWKQSGDLTSVQRFNSTGSVYGSYSAATSSNAAYSDASYARLKNLSLSWQIPTVWKTKVRVQNARIFVQGQNLWTFTKFSGLDPETGGSLSLPPLRVVTFGLQVTF